MKKITQKFLSVFALSASIFATNALAQTNPTPFNLAAGSYSLTQWDSTSAAGTYPPNVVIHTCSTAADTSAFVATANWSCQYNFTSRSRVMGKNANGISFRRTGPVFSDFCDTTTFANPPAVKKFPGAIVLALNTLGRQNITVDWTGRFYGSNGAALAYGSGGSNSTREYAIKLQYRVGTNGIWADVPNTANYSSLATASSFKNVGSFDVVPSVLLPGSCNNQAVIQLRWLYCQVGSGSGVRPELAVDDISVSSTGGTATATITASGATTFCQGGSVTLTASTGTNFSWSTGETTQSIIATIGGAYNVTVTTSNGATAISNSETVTVNPTPSASISSNGPIAICNGNSVTLIANNNAAYLWNTGATTQSIVVTAAGTYTVGVAGANGCSAISAPVNVQVDSAPAMPIISIAGDGLLSCNDISSTYNWYLNGTIISTNTQSFYPTSNGLYQVETLSGQGCVSDTSASINYLITSVSKLADSEGLKAFPNPSTQRVINFSKSITAEIFSAIGAHVYSVVNSKQANLEHLTNGVYFVKTKKGEVLKLILN